MNRCRRSPECAIRNTARYRGFRWENGPCTRSMPPEALDRMQEEVVGPVPEATTRLGNWFAKPLFWRPQYALFVNEETSYQSSRHCARFFARQSFSRRSSNYSSRSWRPRVIHRGRLLAMDDVAVAKTSNRRVVGIMNELATTSTRIRPITQT